MPTYILLLTLTAEGRESTLKDPERLLRAENDVAVPGVSCLGLYGVLGDYDCVTIVEAEDNEAAARFSLEFGVHACAHITTLPAVRIGGLGEPRRPERFVEQTALAGDGEASRPR